MKSKLLQCPSCQTQYDLEKKLCKILPCSCAMCLKCLQEKKNEFDEYVFDCFTCKRKHHLSSLDTLLTSKIICHLLASSTKQTSTSDETTAEGEEADDDNQNEEQVELSVLKNFSNSLAQSIKATKAETIKHYDATLRGIEDRAERLIEVKFKFF